MGRRMMTKEHAWQATQPTRHDLTALKEGYEDRLKVTTTSSQQDEIVGIVRLSRFLIGFERI